VRYEIVAQAYRDLEAASARLELIGRLADLVRQTPDELLPAVALLCQGQIAPDFAGEEAGLALRFPASPAAGATTRPPPTPPPSTRWVGLYRPARPSGASERSTT
jgi:hypothetical protein